MYEGTRKCGELNVFFPIRRRIINKEKKKLPVRKVRYSLVYTQVGASTNGMMARQNLVGEPMFLFRLKQYPGWYVFSPLLVVGCSRT